MKQHHRYNMVIPITRFLYKKISDMDMKILSFPHSSINFLTVIREDMKTIDHHLKNGFLK